MFKKIKKFFKNDDKETQLQWSLYGRVWREIGKPQWKWLLAGVLCTVVAAGAEGYYIMLAKQVVDQSFIEKNISSLYMIGLQIIAAFGSKSAFTYAKTLLMAKAGLLSATNLRRRIFRHMVNLNIGKFHNSQTGFLMNYFTVQSAAVLGLVTDTVISAAHNTITIIIMIGIMIYSAPQLVALLLFIVPAVIVPLIIIMRKKRKVNRRGFGIAGTSTTHVSQTIQGIKTIQSFSSEEIEAKKFDHIEKISIRNAYKGVQLNGIQSPILEIMISVGLFLTLVVGGTFIINGSMSTGDFIAFILALTAAYQPVKRLAGINGGIQNGLIAAEQLFEFLDSKSDIVDAPDAISMTADPKEIKFDKVYFAYNPADGDIINGISLDVKPDQICAFVGPSGGGKTTLFNLIERFYDPQRGRILINDIDIRKYTLKSLRDNIAEVSQDVFLFNGSVADNIKYGAPDASQEEIEQAARTANAHEFILDLPQGYETVVGERGALLSGGQKQRIAIARAILKDAPILLLDEATSALDTRSEKLIQSALKKLMVGRTTFVIAHRLSTILEADIICVIQNGKIIEQGTDAELVKMGGEYKKLRDIQFKKSDK